MDDVFKADVLSDDHAIPREWDRRFHSIWIELNRLLSKSGAATAILLDTSGNAVTYAGEDPEFDLSSFASLAAGDFLATRQMALLLGEESMQWVVHQGKSGGLAMAPLHPLLILAVVFDGRTALGLVRYEMRRHRVRLETATRPLATLLEEQALDRPLGGDEDDASFADTVIGEGLEHLFGPPATA